MWWGCGGAWGAVGLSGVGWSGVGCGVEWGKVGLGMAGGWVHEAGGGRVSAGSVTVWIFGLARSYKGKSVAINLSTRNYLPKLYITRTYAAPDALAHRPWSTWRWRT